MFKCGERFANVWCSVGIHPHEAQKELLTDNAPLLERAKHPKVVAIGETGLDYYYEHSQRNEQKQNFRAHITAARETACHSSFTHAMRKTTPSKSCMKK